MYLSHKDRLIRNPSLRDFNEWPDIPMDSIEKKKRKLYLRNRRVIAMALNGTKYIDIQKITGVSPPAITALLNRALSGLDNATPPLTKALIPGNHIHKPVRKMKLSKIGSPSGAKSSFQFLLDNVPMLKDNLDKVLVEHIKDNKMSENIKPAGFHSYFLLFLDEANHPKDCYPYTEERLGYETVRLYMHRRINELYMERIVKKQPKRIISPTKKGFAFGREIQIDEYTYDSQSTVYLQFMGKRIAIRVARFLVVLIRDADTSCTLAYHLTLNSNCSQFDILSTLEKACTYTRTAKLTTTGINILPGPAFPNEISEEYANVAFNTVALDNALSHCADSVTDYICNTHFGTINLGLPATPKSRHIVEGAFRILSSYAKRYKSTTGKNSNDPIKESKKNYKKPPCVTLQELEEAIYAEIALHNNTPKEYLGGATPLEECQSLMNTTPIRLLPNISINKRNPFELKKRIPVKWLKNEGRLPHINFYNCRYQGKCLSNVELINNEVEVVYDFRDIRTLKVYTLYGDYLGEVNAPKSWQRYPHGVKTRQYIKKFCRFKRIRLKDPLIDYFWIQLNRKNKPRSALEITRLFREYTAFSPSFDPSNAVEKEKLSINSENTTKVSVPVKSFPPWSQEIANANIKE